MLQSESPPDLAEVESWTPVAVRALGVADVSSFTDTVLESLTPLQLRALTPAEIAALAPEVVAAVPSSLLSLLKPSEIGALTTSELGELGSLQLAYITRAAFAAMSADQIGAIAPTQILGLGRGKIAEISAAQAAGLTALEIIGMTRPERALIGAAAVAGIGENVVNTLSRIAFQGLQGYTTTQIAGFSPATLGKLTLAQFDAWIAPDLGRLSPATIGRLPATDLASLTTQQFAALTGADIAALTPTQLGALLPAELAALEPAETAALTATQLDALGAPFLSDLTLSDLAPIEVAGLDPSLVGALSVSEIASLSPAELAAFTPAETAALAPSLVDALGGAFLSEIDLADLTTSQIVTLRPFALMDLTSTEIAEFTPAQTAAFTGAQLDGLDSSFLAALDPASLDASQIGALDAPTVAGLTTPEFDRTLGGALAELSTSAIAGVSLADLASLTSTEIAAFTPQQIAAMTPAQVAALQPPNPIVADAEARAVYGALDYAGVLAVLEDAAAGGMTADKLAGLTTLAGDFAAGTLTTSTSVQQLFDNVALGNPANAAFHGGAVVSTTLGNLTAASTQMQVDELVGKWFLGADMPGAELDTSGTTGPASYQPSALPLFGSSGAPSLDDVAQGDLDDSWLLSALGETALLNPSFIENMITPDGNGVYTVQFEVNNAPDYVTVNAEFPTFTNVTTQGDGSTLEFANSADDLWVPLVEKAAAQLSEQPGVVTGQAYDLNENQYLALAGGDDEALALVTGQSATPEFLGVDATTAANDFRQAQKSLAAGDDVLLQAGFTANGLVGDDVYAVTGIDTASGLVSLFNPLGADSASHGQAETLILSEAALSANGAWLYVATGAPAVPP